MGRTARDVLKEAPALFRIVPKQRDCLARDILKEAPALFRIVPKQRDCLARDVLKEAPPPHVVACMERSGETRLRQSAETLKAVRGGARSAVKEEAAVSRP